MASSKEKADLIIHPVRLRILQFLGDRSLSTSQLSGLMPDVAIPSLYRHLKLLLKGGLVVVVDTNRIKGSEEKIYRCVTPPVLTPEDVESMTKEDHYHYFSAYAATLIQGFKRYLDSTAVPDLLADRVGYREVIFYASNEEFDQMFIPFNQEIQKLMNNSPVNGRKLRKLVVINHPEKKEKKDD